MPGALPVESVLPALRAALSENNAAVLQAPPGAGKTTRIPLALLAAPWLNGRTIIMLEPRRLAAISAAAFMAQQLGEEVGATVGYTIRHERRVSAATRIEVVTEGILTRRLQSDPELSGVGLVILDEFHERNLHTDLALALCRDAQVGLRQDLRLLVMSATLDGAPLAQLLGDCPLVSSVGRTYPVAVSYFDAGLSSNNVAAAVASAIRRIWRETTGDLLTFLPGVGEIRRCRDLLAGFDTEALICPLYADLPLKEQAQALLPVAGRRRLVLATNLAETSLTIEGIAVVVDSGFERRPRFDAARGLSVLDLVRISQASAEQRAGRAGRLGPGRCFRLWNAGAQGSLLPFAPPEIRTADLASLALEVARWGVRDVMTMCWLDPPPAGHLAGARRLLQQLGALDGQHRITPRGEAMAGLPAHPRLARLLLEGETLGEPSLAADLAALLSERDLLRQDQSPASGSTSDVLDRLAALDRYRRAGAAGNVDPVAAAAVERTARQFRRLLRGRTERGGASAVDAGRIARMLLPAWPDRIAREREPGSGRYLLSNGIGARLSHRTAVRGAAWLIALELSAGPHGEGLIHSASALDEVTLSAVCGERLAWAREVDWDERQGRICAREVQRLDALVVAERPIAVTAEDVTAALAVALRREGLQRLNWSEAARQLVARVRCVATHFPAEDWPDFYEEHLLATVASWLGPYWCDCRTRSDLGRLDLVPPLQQRLTWQQRRRLDDLAPERIEVPSGSVLRIDYTGAAGPVLEVKLQELFGLAATPCIAGGRVPLLLHLLSPAQRPVAVTRDLPHFWEQVYPEVKKELKGRYPKHPWPDDPWSAVPTRHTKKRAGL